MYVSELTDLYHQLLGTLHIYTVNYIITLRKHNPYDQTTAMAFTYLIVIKQYSVFRSFQIILQFKFYNKSYLASLHWSVQVFKLLQLFAIKVSSMLLNRGVWIVMKNELAHLLRFLNRMADLENLKSISFCITVTIFNINDWHLSCRMLTR